MHRKEDLICVIAARPNFVKMAPLIRDLYRNDLPPTVVHTGQHYNEMSEIFLKELEIPNPEINLKVGSGTHGEQTAAIISAFEKVCLELKPKLVIVAGDVNSTMATALAAKKLNIDIAHIESGLRSFDRKMPEEINRIVTDHISDLLFVTEESGLKNLEHEGIAKEKIFFVGNTMIDSLKYFLPKALELSPWIHFDRKPNEYLLMTLHRPSNVDHPFELRKLLFAIGESTDLPILFPVHPRTRKVIQQMEQIPSHIRLIEPLGYLHFIGLMANARLILTDSGGIQEESAALQIPCLTIRESTERPATIEYGMNKLISPDPTTIKGELVVALSTTPAKKGPPPLWDGQASQRITAEVRKWLHL